MSSAVQGQHVRQISWKNRPAWSLSNGAIEAVVLEGGGHIADIHLLPGVGPTENLLWEAPWKGIDPEQYDSARDAAVYGPAPVGKFLAGFTGHALCLDYFGAPSDEEAAKGLTLHGEAPASQWSAAAHAQELRLQADLPHAALHVERSISILPGQSVLHIQETVANKSGRVQDIHWVQHVTLGPPLLTAGESMVAIPAERAKTWPLGYGGKSLVPDDVEFKWPKLGDKDLSQPFLQPGTGMVVAALLRRERPTAFIAALNWRLGLVFGYLFPAAVIPWVAVWEENQARDDAPWNGRTQARGLEFGTTPMPLGKRVIAEAGPLFGVPTYLTLAPGETKKVRYMAFAAQAPRSWRSITDVSLESCDIVVRGDGPESVRLAAGAQGY